MLPVRACLAETLSACPVKYTTLQVVDWKKAQREDPALNTLVKNLRSSKEDFMRAMCKVLDPKAARAYEKRRDGFARSHKSHATVDYTSISVEPQGPTRGVWPIATVANDSQLHLVASSI